MSSTPRESADGPDYSGLGRQNEDRERSEAEPVWTSSANVVLEAFGGLSMAEQVELLAAQAAVVSGHAEAGYLNELGSDELLSASRSVETASRCIRSAQLAVVGAIDDKCLFAFDGYRSVSAMMMHTQRLSKAEGGRRARTARALQHLPELAAAYAVGDIGTCQVDRIARLYGNLRIREDVVAYCHRLTKNAMSLPYAEFNEQAKEFERLADEDGAHDGDDRAHRHRDVSLLENFDGSWSLEGKFASAMGATMEAIFAKFIEAEALADWAEARERVGDTASRSDLLRTDAQRRCDALHAIFQAAASAPPDSRRPESVVNIVMTEDDYNAALRYYVYGERGGDLDRFETARCSTDTGHTITSRDALIASMLGHVRRVVVNGKGVVIDLGRKQRLFTGSARDAALLNQLRCVYASCGVSSRHCQIDHLKPWSEHGGTNQHNGAPVCGFHNRWKTKGFRTWRDPHGHWHTYRPNGTEII